MDKISADQSRREFAERILLGDYSSAVIVIVEEGGDRVTWRDGNFTTCVGAVMLSLDDMREQNRKCRRE